MVTPFLFVRLSKNFLVMGGWAQYCNANRIMVTMAGVDRMSVLTATVEVAPPIIAMGLICRIVLDVGIEEEDIKNGLHFATPLAIRLAAEEGCWTGMNVRY